MAHRGSLVKIILVRGKGRGEERSQKREYAALHAAGNVNERVYKSVSRRE